MADNDKGSGASAPAGKTYIAQATVAYTTPGGEHVIADPGDEVRPNAADTAMFLKRKSIKTREQIAREASRDEE